MSVPVSRPGPLADNPIAAPQPVGAHSRGENMKTIGIVAHSAEGGALCFITACRVGQELLGPHLHPEIVVSAVPLAWSMPGWESGDHDVVARQLRHGIEQVARAGADFYICPDNTAHIVLEQIAPTLPIPGLHIADGVCAAMRAGGWKSAGLLGTDWTMTGPVYPAALRRHGLELHIPGPERRQQIARAILDELCLGRFEAATTELFQRSIVELAQQGADCTILGCTEIPLIITNENASLPVLDSTRLLARRAVEHAIGAGILVAQDGWLR
jgi:aspartate racemase